jgi:hypothetical protein
VICCTGPLPIFRPFAESSSNRILNDVLDFGPQDIFRIERDPVIARLPNWATIDSEGGKSKLGGILLQISHEVAELFSLDPDHKMEMGRHENISEAPGVVFVEVKRERIFYGFIDSRTFSMTVLLGKGGSYEEAMPLVLKLKPQPHSQ